MLSMHPVCPELSSIITAWMVTEQSLRLLIRELIIDIMNLSGMEKAEFYLFGISRRYIRIHMQILISWDVFIQMKN